MRSTSPKSDDEKLNQQINPEDLSKAINSTQSTKLTATFVSHSVQHAASAIYKVIRPILLGSAMGLLSSAIVLGVPYFNFYYGSDPWAFGIINPKEMKLILALGVIFSSILSSMSAACGYESPATLQLEQVLGKAMTAGFTLFTKRQPTSCNQIERNDSPRISTTTPSTTP